MHVAQRRILAQERGCVKRRQSKVDEDGISKNKRRKEHDRSEWRVIVFERDKDSRGRINRQKLKKRGMKGLMGE